MPQQSCCWCLIFDGNVSWTLVPASANSLTTCRARQSHTQRLSLPRHRWRPSRLSCHLARSLPLRPAHGSNRNNTRG